MQRWFDRGVPIVVATVLVLNLLAAIRDGSRGDWLTIAGLAALLALLLFLRARRIH